MCLVSFKYFGFSLRDIYIVDDNYRRIGFFFYWIVKWVLYLVFVCFFISIDRIFYYYYSREGGIWVDEFCFVFVKIFYFLYNKRILKFRRWKICYIFKCIIYFFLLFDIFFWNIFCIIFIIGIIENNFIVFL